MTYCLNPRLVIRLVMAKTVKIVSVASLVIAVHLGISATPEANGSTTKPHNVILIMADDMGYECVSANGGESYKTPNLDRLAANGMRFEHCYSQPICTPSRVQIMTGIYNSRNYVRFGLLAEDAYTFGNLARQAGYATCVVGKWQLEGGFDAPYHFGFEEYCLWQLTRRPGRYPNPGLEINGKEVDYSNGEYGPDIVSNYLLDFVERHQDERFFAYYPMILPHWPFEPTPDSPDWDPASKGVLQGHGDPKYFDDMVAYTDKIVGRIARKLKELGLRENTLLLFTGDNGTAREITSVLNGRKVQGGKGTMTDAGTRVPFIASQPGFVPSGEVNGDLIDFSDFFPTLAGITGAHIPDRLNLDGVSFAAELQGEETNRREWSYSWYFRNGEPSDRWEGGEYARTRRFKLYLDGRFYDIANDPEEEHPLEIGNIGSETKRIRRMLRKVLEQNTRGGYYEEHGVERPGKD